MMLFMTAWARYAFHWTFWVPLLRKTGLKGEIFSILMHFSHENVGLMLCASVDAVLNAVITQRNLILFCLSYHLVQCSWKGFKFWLIPHLCLPKYWTSAKIYSQVCLKPYVEFSHFIYEKKGPYMENQGIHWFFIIIRYQWS